MKRWFKYVKPHMLYFILGPLCMIVEVIGEVLMPKFFGSVINSVNSGMSVAHIVGICAVMVVTAFLMMAGGVGGAFFGARASVNFGADLRQDIYRHIQEFSFANVDKFETGSLVTRLTNDVTQLQNFVNMLLRMFLRSPGMFIGAIIMAVILSPSLSVIFAVMIPIVAVVIFTVIRVGFPRFTKMQKKIDSLNTSVQENLTNVRVIKSFVREKYQEEKFKKANKDLKESAINALNIMIFMHPLVMLLMNLTTVLVLWIGGNQVVSGELLVGDLTAFITYVAQILMSLMMVIMMFMTSSRALASAKRIAEVLDEVPDLNDYNANNKDKKIEEGKIEFKNVGFRYYKNSSDAVLQDISFEILPGETVGIIGSTGCGKTSLVSLIPRFYDADTGAVLVDGVDVRDYSLKNLREGIGMVLQKNVLFSGTIYDNIRWGNDRADKETIKQYSDYAQADMFVENLTEGYDTELGQGGVNLSGGQKQRLCIARALVKNPKILILDDSTSAVDTATEARIKDAFSNKLPSMTKIIIAQRISSVCDADKIVVMDEGRVVGIGTHESLLAESEEYREIYYSQNEKKEA